MAFERAFITFTLAVDLDGVPGMCDKPEDFVTIMQQQAKAFGHYKPEITVTETVVKKYVWDEDKQEYIQPKLVDDPRRPKVGDKTFSLHDGENVIVDIRTDGNGPFVIINDSIEAGTEDCIEYLAFYLLTWVESEQRWEYGDLECK